MYMIVYCCRSCSFGEWTTYPIYGPRGRGTEERARVKADGRVDLTIADAKTLARSKAVHIRFVPLFLIGIVRFMPSGPGNPLMLIGALCVPTTFAVLGALAGQSGQCACPAANPAVVGWDAPGVLGFRKVAARINLLNGHVRNGADWNHGKRPTFIGGSS